MLALLAFLVFQASAQSPPRDARPSPASGTAILRGIVVDEPTGEPIGGARVTISAGSGVLDPREQGFTALATTDDAGTFELSGIPAGEFTVTAGPGEFRATHLFTTLGHDGRDPLIGRPSLELTSGEVRENVRIVLKRALALEGRVSNEFGEPMAEVGISVTDDDGRVAASQSASDDRGRFRVFGLREGRYTVCASPASTRDQRASSGEGLQARYNRVCAAPVALTGSTGTPMVDLHLNRVRAFTLSGSVVSATARPVSNLRVQVIPKQRHGFTPNIPTEVKGEQFIARGLLPGEYAVTASIAGPGGGGDLERVAVMVNVDGGDVSGLVLTTAPPGSIRGRVRPVQGAPALPQSRITVRLDVPLATDPELQATCPTSLLPAKLSTSHPFSARTS